MGSDLINFAVIGYGHIGKRHAEMIRSHSRCRLVAVCDVKPELEAHSREQHGVPLFEDAAAMLQAKGEEIHVVSVCTPNGLHASHSLLALEHRKHVVCEKPMGLTKADCEAVIFKALQVSRQVFCVMQNRYSPPSVWLKDVVTSGVLGQVYMVHINCYWNRDDRYYKISDWKGSLALDGGPLFTQFSHFVDIMYWLFGDITDIRARFHNFNHHHNTDFEDSGQVNFAFRNGGLGSINYSTSVWDSNLESSMTIIGSKGSIKVGGQYMEKVEWCHVQDYAMPELPPANPPNDYGPYKGSAANHGFIFQNVVDTLEDGGIATTNALEGLKVVEIIERIYETRPAYPRQK
ncbi:MAG: gfo/Idh/MocA family oxidoreductase [Bacteroidetes bacterium]|nr:gfo/Idh/MocA family oxidoreductase [Bacteroidota bacterium]